MDTIEQARKILRKPIGWIQLDTDFCLDAWQNETELITRNLVNHREGDGHKGWSSCCIHGLSSEKTGHWSQYYKVEPDIEQYKWTELAKKVPNISNFWKNFPVEKYARIRFMQLAPNGYISPHNDAPRGMKNTDFDMMDHIMPVNLAIFHPEDCEMLLENYGVVPWKEGRAFIINITDTHRVINNSKYPRMHMIAHCFIGNKKQEFSNMIVNSYKKYHDS